MATADCYLPHSSSSYSSAQISSPTAVQRELISMSEEWLDGTLYENSSSLYAATLEAESSQPWERRADRVVDAKGGRLANVVRRFFFGPLQTVDLAETPLLRDTPSVEEWFSHPPPAHVAVADASLSGARWLLELGDDWDGEGSCGYAPETFDRMALVLHDIERQSGILCYALPTPAILPAHDGSIDLSWKREGKIVLLVNVPKGDGPITFYGRIGTNSISGAIDPKRAERLDLAGWLIEAYGGLATRVNR